MNVAASSEAFDVFDVDHRNLVKGEWLARVIQYPDGRIRVAGHSDMADDIRSRVGTKYGTTAGLLLTGMSYYIIEDAAADEFSDASRAAATRLLGVDEFIVAAARVLSARMAGGSDHLTDLELRYRLLGGVLGVDTDLLTSMGDDFALPRAWSVYGAGLMVRSLANLGNPFAGIIEAPPEIATLYRAHNESIGIAAHQYHQALIAAGRDALEAAYPGVELRVTTEEDLHDAGLPRRQPAKDEWDDLDAE